MLHAIPYPWTAEHPAQLVGSPVEKEGRNVSNLGSYMLGNKIMKPVPSHYSGITHPIMHYTGMKLPTLANALAHHQKLD